MSPSFFQTIKPITLFDPLAQVLGAVDDGMFIFSYADVVKFAGHSCPTVAGAFMLAKEGLKALYGDEIPVRGNIEVHMPQAIDHEVSGVVAQTIGYIVGAGNEGGFKGLNKMFARNDRLFYGEAFQASVRLKRTDTNAEVTLSYDPSVVATDTFMMRLMQSIVQGNATQEDKEFFATLWQNRVKRLFELNPIKVVL